MILHQEYTHSFPSKHRRMNLLNSTLLQGGGCRSETLLQSTEQQASKVYRLDWIRLHNFLVPMQCMGNSGCFVLGKRSSIEWRYPAFFSFCCVQCFHVFIPSAVRPALLRQMDMGSLTCAQIWVRAVHMNGGQAQTSLHKS